MPISRHAPRTASVTVPAPAPGEQPPYPDVSTTGQQAPLTVPQQQQSEVPPPPPPLPPPEPKEHERRVWAQWWRDSRDDSAARKARSGERRWLMRWMSEQPTSVADLLDYYLHQCDERPDGRRGWGLRTGIPILNLVHAALYRAYGLTIALALTLAAYALGWMSQRPGRAVLLGIGAAIVHANLSAWLGGEP
ncbi:hypothetical protein OG339_48155 (plasmid) [Streptosporangium sp. NBC_01495]|uniref:hypothetical protein n=1 Tax=Streptosporangium sp. NBC_01495 TaxID=2903899 RepID=UPI002E30F31B|nr:hypothetical protein [Streptosporangium sp. NBC_01495]